MALTEKQSELVEMFCDDEMIFLDGFDNAIIGVDSQSNRVVYSYRLILEQLMSEDMSEVDAIEHVDYNIINAYVGERTPIYVYEVYTCQYSGLPSVESYEK